MAAGSASFLGSVSWAYPTVPGTYDLTTVITVNQDCPADSAIMVGSLNYQASGGVLPMTPQGSPPVRDDGGLSYFVSGGASVLSAVDSEVHSILRLDFYQGVRYNILNAGQKITLRRTSVTIGTPVISERIRGFAVDFAYLWQGVNALSSIAASGGISPYGGPIAVSSGARLDALTGTFDLIGVGAVGLWNEGHNVGDSPPVWVDQPVGSIGGIGWAEDSPFARDQTLVWDTAWNAGSSYDPVFAAHLNGPGVYLSKATVTRASPTSEVYTATLTDPTSPPDGVGWLGAFVYPSSYSPVVHTLAGVWNIHTEFGQYQRAYAKNDVLHYASVDAPVPPTTSDANVAMLPAGAKDSEPRMVRDWLARTWLVFTRTVSGAPNVFSVVSDAEGVTWSDPIMAFAGGKHPDISFDPRTGEVFRAAYVSGQIKGLVTDAAGATSPLFTLVDQNGAALAPDDDVFHVVPAPEGPFRWLLVMVKGGNVVDLYSADQGRTWRTIP